jgi:peptidoglycan/LPS O-acetylase OafA/YrhL
MKIDALTPLRFIAAAVVVIFHFGLKGSDYIGFFSAGPQMVSFFFVLSGFVMAFAHYEKPLDLEPYYIARAARWSACCRCGPWSSWARSATACISCSFRCI